MVKAYLMLIRRLSFFHIIVIFFSYLCKDTTEAIRITLQLLFVVCICFKTNNMDNLKTLLDNNDLTSLKEMTNDFFVAAEGYGNKLKLSIAVATIITKSLSLLQSVDTESFISELRDKLNKVEADVAVSREVHMDHLRLDNEVRSALCKDGDALFDALERDISDALMRMDTSLKELILLRDKLPMSKVVDGRK